MNILDLLFPKRCLGCGRVGSYFCNRCSSTVRIINTNEMICPVCEKLAVDGITHPKCQTKYTLDGLVSFFRYDGVVRKAIKGIKYRFVSDIAESLIKFVPKDVNIEYNKALPHLKRRTILVPIPLHKNRLYWRGFNQAELLGSLIAKRIKVALEKNLLVRQRMTIPQVEMKDRETRLANMKNVFSVDRSVAKGYPDSAVILFDDVFTTGATMRAAASALKHAGFTCVLGMTLAR